ncbi:pre-mRNA-splicing factor CWC22 homolog [Actinia tenebrosa]|uniref:Pre-mRNA-splicing factor CWC22 homolog n=1 Tax=Actinia tenebrosa TaxID=6105 RepID=A0A6P8IET2_ACTTE|nr:pre-mRNA-splicing factor CWC22 homolog [Actinia tenebrosa]
MSRSDSEGSVETDRARVRSVVQRPKATRKSRKEYSRSRSRSRSRSPINTKRDESYNDGYGNEKNSRRRRYDDRDDYKYDDEEMSRRRTKYNDQDDYKYRHDKRRRRSYSSGDEDRNQTRDRESEDDRKKASEKEKNGNEEGINDQKGETGTEKRKTEDTKKKENNPLLMRTGGAYIPPARLKMMQESITDKSSEAYQRISWEALKKSINGLINKVNTSNLGFIVRELFQENIVRGRGLLAQSIIRAQFASPTFTHVYAALVSIINTKFPKNGELILRRLILQFRRAFRRNDKAVCLNTSRFIAHLVNQQVAHEILALEVLTLLLHKPTDDSVEVGIGFLKECGMKLTEVSPRGVHAVFERLRSILHSGEIDRRVEYMIEVMFAIRKDGFKDHVAIPEGLDLVEEEDQITHLLRLEESGTAEDILNIFKMDPNFLENEEKYKEIKKEILGESDDDDSDDDDEDDDDDDDDEDEDEEGNKDEEKMNIIDHTETNLVALRRTIYLTIQSSLDYEECAHKLLKMNLQPEQVPEFCVMVIDCCAQQRSYEKFFGLLAQRFCTLKKEYVDEYVKLFKEQYESIHRLETNKLRNVAKFFGHLLFTDAIPWTVLECIHLNEDETTSSSRVFIKILFQELAEYMGMPKLNERLKDPFLVVYFEGLFPRDNPRNTRFSINFFTSIGLGGVTDELREHLKNAPKMIMAQKHTEASDSDSSSSGDSSDESSSEESSSEESSSESEDSEEERRRRRKQKSRRKKEATPPKKHKRKTRK